MGEQELSAADVIGNLRINGAMLYVRIMNMNGREDEALKEGQVYCLKIGLLLMADDKTKKAIDVFATVFCQAFEFKKISQQLDIFQKDSVAEFELTPIVKGDHTLEVILSFNGEPLFSRKFPVKVC